MLPFIQAPAIAQCHSFSFGTRADVTGGRAHCVVSIDHWRLHCLSCLLRSNWTSSFETWPFDVQLCPSVSCCLPAFLPGQRCSPQCIVCPPETLSTSFEQACQRGDKTSERMGFESANGSCFPWNLYRFTIQPLKPSVCREPGTLLQFLSLSFVQVLRHLADFHIEILFGFFFF